METTDISKGMTCYEPTEAFLCRFSNLLVSTRDKALEIDIRSACALISIGTDRLELEIKTILKHDNVYNDVHRAILFLGEVVKKRVDEIVAGMEEASGRPQ